MQAGFRFDLEPSMSMGLRRWHSGRESSCQCRRYKRWGCDPLGRKILWSRKQQPTPVFLPGESHGQRSLAGYSLWDRKESNMTERACARTHTHTHKILVVFEDFSGGHSGGHGRVPVLLKQT